MSEFLDLARNEKVAAINRRVVAQLPLRQVFKIDFKKDAIKGRFYMPEINTRHNLWSHMAARNGINLPQVAHDYRGNGTRPADTRYRTTFRWFCVRPDFHAYREPALRGELNFGKWLLSLPAPRRVYDLFSWKDPLSFLFSWGNRVQSRLRRRFDYSISRLWQWLSTAS